MKCSMEICFQVYQVKLEDEDHYCFTGSVGLCNGTLHVHGGRRSTSGSIVFYRPQQSWGKVIF